MSKLLDEAEILVFRAFDLCCAYKPEVRREGSRLIVDDLWSVSQKGKGWQLIRKYAVPEDVKLLLDPPRDFEYVSVFKQSHPLVDVLRALVLQFSHLRIEGGIQKLKELLRQNA